jgi:hypothetical protein
MIASATDLNFLSLHPNIPHRRPRLMKSVHLSREGSMLITVLSRVND